MYTRARVCVHVHACVHYVQRHPFVSGLTLRCSGPRPCWEPRSQAKPAGPRTMFRRACGIWGSPLEVC